MQKLKIFLYHRFYVKSAFLTKKRNFFLKLISRKIQIAEKSLNSHIISVNFRLATLYYSFLCKFQKSIWKGFVVYHCSSSSLNCFPSTYILIVFTKLVNERPNQNTSSKASSPNEKKNVRRSNATTICEFLHSSSFCCSKAVFF